MFSWGEAGESGWVELGRFCYVMVRSGLAGVVSPGSLRYGTFCYG